MKLNLAPFIRIARPANSFAVGVLVLTACLVAGASWELWFPVMLATLGSVLVAAGGYVINDVYDYKLDQLIHPERVLPKGEMGIVIARAYALALLIGSPLFFVWVNPHSLLNVALVALLLFFYSWRLKGTNGLIGNFTVAVLASNCVLIGGFVIGNFDRVASLTLCIFFATLAREVIKDIEDLPGDQGLRANTIPMLVGNRKAGQLVAGSLFLAIVSTYLPYQQRIFGPPYLFAVSAVNLMIIFKVIRPILSGSEAMAALRRNIKAGMFLNICIFFIAALIK